MKNIAILLIIVSLASLGGLVYPTVPVTEASTRTSTVRTTVSGSTSIWTEGVVYQWFFTVCPDTECAIPNIITVTYRQLTTYSSTFYPHTYTANGLATFTGTSILPYYAASAGIGGTIALLLVVAVFLAGVGLLVRTRKGNLRGG